MYSVMVFAIPTAELPGNGEAIATRNFLFGQWKEIGFWLDENYYNSGRYYVRIEFIEA